jgi:hypothetical protein
VLAEGHNWIEDFTEPGWVRERLKKEAPEYASRIDLQADYGRVRITIEQLGMPEDAALATLEESDAEAWTPPTALVVFPKDLEAARAIIRASFAHHSRNMGSPGMTRCIGGK